MFDNLKEKLGSFRDSAEEAAEENVEDVDEADLEEEELETVESEAEPDAAEATDTTPDPGADEPAAPATATAETEPEPEPEPETTESASGDAAGSAGQESATDAAPDRLEADDAASVSETAADEPAETATSDEEPADEGDDDSGGGLGIGAKARSLFGGSSGDADADADTDVDADTDAESDVETPTEDEPSPSPADPAETSDARESTGDTDEATGDTDTDADADADTDANGGTGFGAKAKSLVKGKFVIEAEDLEGPLHELELALLSSDVEMGVAEEILDNLRDELIGETRTFTTSTGEVVEEALHDAIYDVISVGQFDFNERIAIEDKPVTIVFTGVNGVGKTTTIAKLSRYFEERGYSTVMANGDTYRAGANEQIQEHADALDTKCISHEQGGDPAAVLYDAVEYAEANDIDIVLGDTAGRLHTDEGLMDQLEKIDRVVGPDMTLFVDEAVAGQDAVNRAREFNDAAEIDGAILTKADADSNGGAAISIAHVTGKPILFLGVGQGYDDLERFDPEQMVDRLLGEDEE
ncbi:signal recognition particle-docking protein FtsY [Natrinema hispanicum]|uniref:Signal recognition particle receptor FtsY n=1 Tax=Natrinema hispanicum TaxID=392421 RepID=A0A1G6QZW1_9EURY|nr:signal recognition particle-docking protein FtsY [Natrinema hispanicum]SDC97196.1 signal recognition particle-docking protein FtsY [Natrinema hispanicum]SET74060.1 signal recognition particle-docking protein FtsY [Natrinema hispanicum]